MKILSRHFAEIVSFLSHFIMLFIRLLAVWWPGFWFLAFNILHKRTHTHSHPYTLTHHHLPEPSSANTCFRWCAAVCFSLNEHKFVIYFVGVLLLISGAQSNNNDEIKLKYIEFLQFPVRWWKLPPHFVFYSTLFFLCFILILKWKF